MADVKRGHGHPGNTFHTVVHPGMTTSFYLSGDELATLALATQSEDKTVLAAQARRWFHEMMTEKRDEFAQSSQNSSQNS